MRILPHSQMALMENFDETVTYMDQNPPIFPGYEAFLKEYWEDMAEK